MSREQNMSKQDKRCKHGHVGYCGFCASEGAPECKHGRPYYCGLCRIETGDGLVPPTPPASPPRSP